MYMIRNLPLLFRFLIALCVIQALPPPYTCLLYTSSASITYNLATLQEENCNYSYNKNYISFTLKYCGSEKIFQTLASYS